MKKSLLVSGMVLVLAGLSAAQEATPQGEKTGDGEVPSWIAESNAR